MDVDVVLVTVYNIGNIAIARYYEKSTGVIGHGEFIIVILSIPGRSYAFSSLRVGSEPISKSI